MSKLIADHWKERALRLYARQLFKHSIQFIGLLLLCFAPFFLLLYPGIPTAAKFGALVFSWPGIVVGTLVAFCYAKLRSSTDSNNSYGSLSRVLHRLALGNDSVPEITFEIERSFHARKASDRIDDGHVFVAGLARAGTTALMRTLYKTDAFHSLTYRDMPFVLAPNIWRNINRNGQASDESRERSHGDGIKINFDSPEALEEVFWRIQNDYDYIRSDRLIDVSPPPETIEAFRDYVRVILKNTERRYLSKNNNSLLRIPALQEAFPASFVLVPFRAPLQQAESLRRQHIHFCGKQAKDPFTRSYMRWLGHHEFGLEQKPFVFGEDPLPTGDRKELDYWLRLWLNTYRNVQKHLSERVIPIAYEDLCAGGMPTWRALFKQLSLATAPGENLMSPPPLYDVGTSDRDLLHQSEALYSRLRVLSPLAGTDRTK